MHPNMATLTTSFTYSWSNPTQKNAIIYVGLNSYCVALCFVKKINSNDGDDIVRRQQQTCSGSTV